MERVVPSEVRPLQVGQFAGRISFIAYVENQDKALQCL
jgi:hypothetical protein